MNTDATPLRLSPTARAALKRATAHPEHRVALPALPAAARNGVIRSMLRAGLVEEVATEGEDGAVPKLRATAVGLLAVGLQAPHEVVGPDNVRWSPTVGQFDGLVKLGPGCCQAANLIMLPTP
jgi:hypothetical protein